MKNQKGFLDLTLILALVIIIAVGGFVWWRVSNADEPTVADSTYQNSNSDKSSIAVVQKYEEIGLQQELPQGWTVSRTEDTNKGFKSVSYLVENSNSDLSIDISLSGFLGGFYGCSAGELGSISAVNRMLVSEPTESIEYHILGYSNVSVDPGASNYEDSLILVNSDELRWYENNPGNYASSDNPGIESKNLVEGREYFVCATEPRPGMFIDTPLKFATGDDMASMVNISVSSDTNSLVEHITSRSKDFADVLSILKSTKSTQ
jgi:hypothetical protein